MLEPTESHAIQNASHGSGPEDKRSDKNTPKRDIHYILVHPGNSWRIVSESDPLAT